MAEKKTKTEMGDKTKAGIIDKDANLDEIEQKLAELQKAAVEKAASPEQIIAKISKEGDNAFKADIVEPVTEEEIVIAKKEEKTADVSSWNPKTETGRMVKEGKIKSLGDLLDSGRKVLETQIIDALVPNLETDLLMIGQSKGKFGGGKRRVFKQTQKKTMEGNKPKFSTVAVSGNKDGLVGVGYGKSKETVPAREKAFVNAKLNMIKIRRGCGDWRCGCKTPHSIPFKVRGKCGSVIITLMPAPKGKGLCVEKECQKILGLAGIKDVWSKTKGKTVSKINLINACVEALKSLMAVKVTRGQEESLGILEGETKVYAEQPVENSEPAGIAEKNEA